MCSDSLVSKEALVDGVSLIGSEGTASVVGMVNIRAFLGGVNS